MAVNAYISQQTRGYPSIPLDKVVANLVTKKKTGRSLSDTSFNV